MYKTISDFLKDWESEKGHTLKIFSNLTDDSLQFRSYPKGRTLGKIAWHIISSASEMGKMAGLGMEMIEDKVPADISAAYLVSLYDKVSQELSSAVAQWNEAMLEEEITLYGEKWTRSFTLHVLVRHQVHHRAQMTILMREAGLKVPGIYGPSREEWAQYNMQEME